MPIVAKNKKSFASLGDDLEAVWSWDSGSDSFLTFRPDLPAALNTLQTISVGDAVWILMANARSWSLVDVGQGDGLLSACEIVFPDVCK